MKRPSKDELEQFNAYYTKDTAFAAHARLLQSKWRQAKGYPVAEGKLGNYLELEDSKTEKSNFLTNNIKQLVTQEIANAKQTKALIGEPRIWNNLLSSQPLCFNLFGELSPASDLTTRYFQALFPGRIDKVTAVKFEYSPGRRKSKYLGDNSAFDVFVEYTKGGKRGFIGIEVKYSESLKEETKAIADKNFKSRYAEVTEESVRFKPNSVEALRQPPIAQIWRDHLLSISLQQDYDEGFFVFLFPSENEHCQQGVNEYRKFLASDHEVENGFYPRHLEEFVDTMVSVSGAEWAKELKMRYLGLT